MFRTLTPFALSAVEVQPPMAHSLRLRSGRTEVGWSVSRRHLSLRHALDQPVAKMHHGAREARHLGLVRDHQHGDSAIAVEPRQQFHDLERAFGVEIAGRLVGEQHVGVGDDGARDRDALLLAARQLGGRVARPIDQPDLIEGREGGGPPRAFVIAAIEQGQLDILECGGARQQVEPLEDEAQIAPSQQRALVAAEALDMMASEQEAAGGRHVEAAEDVHRRRFARSRRAHHGHEVARSDIEIDALQRLERGLAAAEAFGDADQPDQGIGRRSGHHRAHLPFCASLPVATCMPGLSASLVTLVNVPLLSPTSTFTGAGSPLPSMT